VNFASSSYYFAFFGVELATGFLAHALEGIPAWDLFWLLFQRIYYRQPMLYSVAKSALRRAREAGGRGQAGAQSVRTAINLKRSPGSLHHELCTTLRRLSANRVPFSWWIQTLRCLPFSR
jgi:hypothetical protein